MTWVQFTIAVGYLLVLLALFALGHGASLVYRDLQHRREAEKKAAHSGQHIA